MADWKKRAIKSDDVVYFPYQEDALLSQVEQAYVWDVDKTYLDTKFETIKGLWRTATEKANQKKNVPGTGELVRSLQKVWKTSKQNHDFAIFFITASPPQMERKIKEKLGLDEVFPFGIFTKDNLANLRPRRFWRLNKQVGYKVQALLQLRKSLSAEAKMILFGDDGESDAIIYSLFSDICARRLNTAEIRQTLSAFFVLDDQIDTILRLQDEIPNHDPVEKVYINLIDDTDADYYLKFGRRMLPTSSTLQAALDLYQDDRLDTERVIAIAQNLITKHDHTMEEIERHLDDLIRRERLCQQCAEKIIGEFKKHRCIREEFQPSVPLKPVLEKKGNVVISLQGNFDPWIPEKIDYIHDYR